MGSWGPPATFSWEDLSFEPAGPDAVVVVGRFLWESTRFSYSALLVRQDGVLRIRMEDESQAPSRSRPPESATR